MQFVNFYRLPTNEESRSNSVENDTTLNKSELQQWIEKMRSNERSVGILRKLINKYKNEIRIPCKFFFNDIYRIVFCELRHCY